MVVGPEKKGAFSKYFEKTNLPFTGLPNPKHTVLKRYGQEFNLFKLGRMPAQVVIDKEGIARYAHYGHSMSDIPENEEILEILREINGKAENGNTRSDFSLLLLNTVSININGVVS